jgi:ABC-2 type transport system ATP-binding protein
MRISTSSLSSASATNESGRASSRDGPALSAHGLSKRFGYRVAFQDVSFEIGYSEVFGFLGPNGAGKTTTVRTLGTLVAPTSGSATVAGIPLAPENGIDIRRRISIMPESPGLYLRLSVRENLECFADLYETPRPGERIERALRAVNLAERASDACGARPRSPTRATSSAASRASTAGAGTAPADTSCPCPTLRSPRWR